VLEQEGGAVTPNHPTALAVVARVAALYGIDAAILWRKGKQSPSIIEARQLAMWALRERTRWSYPELGTALGVDHTAVMHGVRRASERAVHKSGTGFLRDAVLSLGLPWGFDDPSSERPPPEPITEPVNETGNNGVGTGCQPEVCPPSLVLSPSESGVPSLALSASFLASDSGSKGPDSKPARAPRAKPRTPPPERVEPSARHREIATQRGLELETEIERCLNYHRGKGNTMANWGATVTTWLLSPYAKATVNGGPPGKPPPGANFERLRARAERLELEEKRNATQ
jgi:hypothetical protein